MDGRIERKDQGKNWSLLKVSNLRSAWEWILPHPEIFSVNCRQSINISFPGEICFVLPPLFLFIFYFLLSESDLLLYSWCLIRFSWGSMPIFPACDWQETRFTSLPFSRLSTSPVPMFFFCCCFFYLFSLLSLYVLSLILSFLSLFNLVFKPSLLIFGLLLLPSVNIHSISPHLPSLCTS